MPCYIDDHKSLEATLRHNIQSNITAIFFLIVGVGWIWLSRSSPDDLSADGKIAPRAGFLAPDFSLLDRGSNQITLSELRGRPVIINLWASWCIPCREEMPALEQVHVAYKDQGLIVLAVNATNQDNQQAAIRFSDNLGLTFPILFDTQGSVSKAYRLQSLPTTYFVDQNGIIQEVVVGGPMAEALLRVRVEALLEGTYP